MGHRAEPIEFFNRYTGRVDQEEVYGERWLRWAYETSLGRWTLWSIISRTWFSRWYGWRMNRPESRDRVLPFCEHYGIDTSEFEIPAEHFLSFNDFFFRKLNPMARPIRGNADTAIFPADGRHLGFPDVARVGRVYVKGQRFDLSYMLQDQALTARYANGALVLSRLCPVDYHRFHFPVAGVPQPSRGLAGPLYSVNPVSLRRNLNILASNRRVMCPLQTDRFGIVLLIEIGATCVGCIEQTYVPGSEVEKGREKGFFRFGGSSLITLFEPGRIELSEDLLANTRLDRELYAHMGDEMGRAV